MKNYQKNLDKLIQEKMPAYGTLFFSPDSLYAYVKTIVEEVIKQDIGVLEVFNPKTCEWEVLAYLGLDRAGGELPDYTTNCQLRITYEKKC